MLELNSETRSVAGWEFAPSDVESAVSWYRKREEDSIGNPRLNVVLVSTDTVNSLRRAYPNYFADIGGFRRMVEEVTGWE